MQPCNRIYYSTVHWRLNMFRAAYRSSSGALYLQPLVYIRMWWPAVVKSEWEFPLRLDYGRSQHAYVNQRLQIQSSWWWAVCPSKHVEPSINGGIINSNTRLHLVGYFYGVTCCNYPMKSCYIEGSCLLFRFFSISCTLHIIGVVALFCCTLLLCVNCL